MRFFPVIAAAMSVVVIMAIMVQGQVICNIPVEGLRACKPAVTPPRPSFPTRDCCSALSHGNIRCLCSYMNSPLLPSLGVDPKLAIKLPQKCGLPAPPC
ncbi:Putative lipid-transfer protein DIR1 [Linum perenne]